MAAPGELLSHAPESWREDWEAARADRFVISAAHRPDPQRHHPHIATVDGPLAV